MRDGNRHVHVNEIIDICARQGRQYEASNLFTLQGSIPNYVFFQNNSDFKIILYSRSVSYDGTGVSVEMHRDPILETEDLVQLDIIRTPNDINPVDSNVTLYSVLSGSVVDEGDETRSPVHIFGNATGAARGAPNQTISKPQFIDSYGNVLLSISTINGNANQIVSGLIEWVEASRIPGIDLNNEYSGVVL